MVTGPIDADHLSTSTLRPSLVGALDVGRRVGALRIDDRTDVTCVPY